ncbi:MAG TPA: hypothetical protein VNO33_23110 [Kofleriaceae bacterium]|nr:hypothetical protein [Kofleriaceae bacterium]
MRPCLSAIAPALALIPVVAHAQSAAPAEPDAKPAEAAREWTLELGGRVFLRDTVSRVDVGDRIWRHDRAIDQARVSADYDRKRLRLAIEVDFAGGDADLKDTYIRVTPLDGLRLQAGRFKVPMSFLGMESKWRLPSTERGLLSELDPDDRDLPFTGERADGIAVQLRPAIALEPRFTAAAFQSPLAGGLSPIDASEELTQDLYLRAEIEPVRDIHLAAGFAMVGYHEQLGEADSFRHVPIASLELHADTRHVRAWIEGFAGESFFYQPDGGSSGRFVAARALVSPRFRRPFPAVFRVEPYAGASLLEPTDDRDQDRVSEIVAGVNVAFSRYLRLQIEGAQRVAEGGESAVADTTLFRIQLGASFSEQLE